MPSWKFNQESLHDSAGANTEAGLTAGNQPFFEANNLASKRNVIATSKGWVRRQNYTDTHGNARVKEEVLVAAHPGPGGFDYTANTYLGTPDIAQIYLGPNTATGLTSFANNAAMNVYVVFNEPVFHDGGAMKLFVSNTVTTVLNGFTLTANNDGVISIVNANNTLVFTGTITSGAGTYKIHAASNTIINATSTATALKSLNVGNETANATVTGAVSNTLGTFTVV